tara:strand:- start:144 stop:1307 length:1164 start_codon:yes stop_codon:yes gene_type:complete
MNLNQIIRFKQKQRCTLLGAGPMSINCTNAAINLANKFKIPIFLIASRRQIDAEIFGGGYVNNWDTRRFSDYVIDRDKSSYIVLSRDHGGPWQNTLEIDNKLSLRRAMESAKESFKADIDSGFQVLHIDPSVCPFEKATSEEIFDRFCELYEFCYSYSLQKGKDIIIEIGTEEQTGETNRIEELDSLLNSTKMFCNKNNLPFPSFVVVQTGTRVLETKNVGSFDSPLRVRNEIPAELQIPRSIDICNSYGIMLKEHNADYLSEETLKVHPKLGIHAANVAPEFGVAETLELIRIMKELNATNLMETFLNICLQSNKWKKWMINDSKASDLEKSIIAGHYNFSDDRVIEIKHELNLMIRNNQKSLDLLLQEAVEKSIMRYLKAFCLVK